MYLVKHMDVATVGNSGNLILGINSVCDILGMQLVVQFENTGIESMYARLHMYTTYTCGYKHKKKYIYFETFQNTIWLLAFVAQI